MTAAKKAAHDSFARALAEFDCAVARLTHCQPGMAEAAAADLAIAQQRLEKAEAEYESAA
jgi:hypothetical protein